MLMKVEYCEQLVLAMLERAMIDYVLYVRRLPVLRQRLANCKEFRPRKKGEDDNLYRQRKYLKSKTKINKDIERAEELVRTSREFLESEWLERYTDYDGVLILKKLNKQLKLEGYEV